MLNREKGSLPFYLLITMPIAVSLSMVAVDISGWNAMNNALQKEADQIALQALDYLPDTESAANYIIHATSFLNFPSTSSKFNFANDHGLAINLKLQSKFDPYFNVILEPFLKNQESLFSINKESTAQIIPTDYVLIMVDGSSMRPGIEIGATLEESKADTPWGNNLSWPASDYFNCATKPIVTAEGCEITNKKCTGDSAVWDWWNHWESEAFKRWATQSCFNPVFSKIKTTAINFIDYISATPANRVSVIFTPGNSRGQKFQTIRNLREEQKINGITYYKNNIGGFFKTTSIEKEAHWNPNIEGEHFLGDEACVMLAHSSLALNKKYQIPKNLFNSELSSGEILPFASCGNIHFPYQQLSQEYLNSSLKLREAVYFRSAKLNLPGKNSKPDILLALQQAWKELVSIPNKDILKSEVDKRGNLAHFAKRKIILLTDSFPEQTSELENIISNLKLSNTKLIVASFNHPGQSIEEQNSLISNLSGLISIDNNLKDQISDDSTVYLFEFNSVENLEEKMLPIVTSIDREVLYKT